MGRELQGHLALHLHAHLPFVRHPEPAESAEEDWFHEAVLETYLPLVGVLDRLAEDEVPFRISMSLSPTLLAMLRDDLLVGRLARRLERLLDLADREVRRTRKDPVFHALARHHRDGFRELQALLEERHRRDLVAAFRRLEDAGRLELVTTGATHGFLPLLQEIPEAVRAQVAVAVASHRRHLGRAPAGIWLPECGYHPGVEGFLAEQGLRWFVAAAHGVTGATPRPRHGVHAPLFTPGGPAAFGRDPEASGQVWGAGVGYPGDPAYRSFHRDLGWELDWKRVRPFVRPDGSRRNLGIRYFRIGADGRSGEPWDPVRARERAAAHADDFLAARRREFERLAGRMRTPPVVVAAWDAELLGHWWHEGPWFLEALVRRAAADPRGVRLATPGDHLRAFPAQQVATPAESSWGAGGHAGPWLDGSNDWIYRHLHQAARRMVALAADFPAPGARTRRALRQAGRELLLAQSSDWAFLMKTGTRVDYAIRRTREHLLRFTRIHDQVRAGAVDEAWLARVESRDPIFPEIDHRAWSPAI